MNASETLKHGDKFPYDAPDTWWESGGDEPPPPATDWAHAAARGILVDLTDRRGIKSGFGTATSIDEDVRAELVLTLAAIIREAESNRI